MSPKILVLGAGLTGISTALALREQGFAVTVLDRDHRPMNRASRRNEGKIHLGLIYAADPTFHTADLQLRGALTFMPLLRRWLGERVDAIPVSTPFTYLVAHDSLFTPTQLAAHYERLETAAVRLQAEHPDWNYLGRPLGTLARPLERDEIARWFDPNRVQAAFDTAELAIDTDVLADLTAAALLEAPDIDFMGGHQVQDISRRGGGFVVTGRAGDEPFALDADVVVNATWEQRFALDRQVGLDHRAGWLHRLKYRVIARLPEELADAPSATMVLGRYGDVVVRPDGSAYLSWYPLGLRGWTQSLAPPRDWDAACRGDTGEEEAAFATEVAREIGHWFPGIEDVTGARVDAGAIVAYGSTDVDDPDSQLHDRTRVGISQAGGWFSVDPGKLTTAPWYGEQTAAAVATHLARGAAR